MTTTTDDAHSIERTPLIPSRLGAALTAWLLLVGIYATIVITQAALERPMPRMLHGTVVAVLAVAAIAWLAVWIVVTVDRHTEAVVAPRLDAINRQVESNHVALDALLADAGRRKYRAVVAELEGQPDDSESSMPTVSTLPPPDVRRAVVRLQHKIGRNPTQGTTYR